MNISLAVMSNAVCVSMMLKLEFLAVDFRLSFFFLD